ncbi:MAG: response regulator [Proteobacteria bacterium]|nr:response regulator [Pseudomonadota bacterium]
MLLKLKHILAESLLDSRETSASRPDLHSRVSSAVEVIHEKSQNLAASFSKHQSETAPIKILIVDDLKENLLALEGLLTRDDLAIFKTTSGITALDLMIQHDFALALIDVQMPAMSGFELAELMRGCKRTKHIPVIFVTANSGDQSFAFKGYASGAVDFLLKPLDPHTVKSKANIFIELYKQKGHLKHHLKTIGELLLELSQAKSDADSANSAKTQFLANMSHEIRTPVSAILGYTKLMQNGDNTAEKLKDYGTAVERNSLHLLALIDDILDLSKVESGMMTLERTWFSFEEFLKEISVVMAHRAEGKGIQFEVVLDASTPETLHSDPVRLRQILNNIVGNAIKFTSHGRVIMAVSWTNETLRITIQDTGIGIASYQIGHLFKAFSQANITTTRKFGGTGLGLALSRSLAEAMGGTLTLLESVESKGSTFLVELPVKIAAVATAHKFGSLAKVSCIPAPNQKNEQPLNGLKVLLVEDTLDIQLLISACLTDDGADVTTAGDGAKGVELALSRHFDVIIMDLQMPILDGHEATRELRLQKYAGPIIALSASAMSEERAKCQKSGFTDFISKPIHSTKFSCIIFRATSNQPYRCYVCCSLIHQIH